MTQLLLAEQALSGDSSLLIWYYIFCSDRINFSYNSICPIFIIIPLLLYNVHAWHSENAQRPNFPFGLLTKYFSLVKLTTLQAKRFLRHTHRLVALNNDVRVPTLYHYLQMGGGGRELFGYRKQCFIGFETNEQPTIFCVIIILIKFWSCNTNYTPMKTNRGASLKYCNH